MNTLILPIDLLTTILTYMTEEHTTGNYGLHYFGLLNKTYRNCILNIIQHSINETLITIKYSNYVLATQLFPLQTFRCIHFNISTVTDSDINKLNIDYHTVILNGCNNITSKGYKMFENVKTMIILNHKQITKESLQHFAGRKIKTLKICNLDKYLIYTLETNLFTSLHTLETLQIYCANNIELSSLYSLVNLRSLTLTLNNCRNKITMSLFDNCTNLQSILYRHYSNKISNELRKDNRFVIRCVIPLECCHSITYDIIKRIA